MSRLTFIRAGAGSGKAYTLTQKLGELLDAGAARPSGVIAATCTKKAATELRERVIKTDVANNHFGFFLATSTQKLAHANKTENGLEA